MATVVEILTRLGNATDNDLVTWRAWNSGDQNPNVLYSCKVNRFNFDVNETEISMYGPDGLKGSTSTGYSQIVAKIISNLSRQTPVVEPTPESTTLDDVYNDIPTT